MDTITIDNAWRNDADMTQVYSCVNASELEIGDIVYVGNTLKELQQNFYLKKEETVVDIEAYSHERRIVVSGMKNYALAYLVKHIDPDEVRPYTSVKEMLEEYRLSNNYPGSSNENVIPTIWVKAKSNGDLYQITAFFDSLDSVRIGDGSLLSLNSLFEDYTYPNGNPCGVVAGEYFVN